jgi:hypothetical protein
MTIVRTMQKQSPVWWQKISPPVIRRWRPFVIPFIPLWAYEWFRDPWPSHGVGKVLSIGLIAGLSLLGLLLTIKDSVNDRGWVLTIALLAAGPLILWVRFLR